MKKIVLISTWILSISLGFCSVVHSAQNDNTNSEEIIKSHFQAKFEAIEAFMKINAKDLPPNKLLEFVDKEVMQAWSAELTIRAIIGASRWKVLSESEKTSVIDAYTNTMQRYLFETFQKYSGQKAIADELQFNAKRTKGWLTAKLEIDNFPDLAIDLKLFHQKRLAQLKDSGEKGKWLIYDFRFQGISFIKLKQSEYQTIIDEQGIKSLINQLVVKNQAFNASMKQEEIVTQ